MIDADILKYIPQRPPMVMIDQLLAVDGDRTVCSFTVPEQGVLINNGYLSESGLTENMAQTAAAGVGFKCHRDNQPVPLGFIASIKNLTIHGLPEAGTTLQTETNVINQVMDVNFVYGTVRGGNRLFAECELRIFLNPIKTS